MLKVSFITFFLTLFLTAANSAAVNESVDELEKLLRNRSMVTRHEAAQKLSKIGGPRVVQIFQRLVQKNSLEYKRIGLAGLAATAPRESIPLFLDYLSDPSMQLRWAAVIGLGNALEPAYLPQLKKIARTDSSYISSQKRYPVREAARAAVEKIESSPDWFYSYQKGKAAAMEQGKDLIIFWNIKGESWSEKMKERSFTGPGIKKIRQKFVWIFCDAVEKVELADQMNIQQIPLIQLLNAEEVELERWTGYYSAEVLSSDLSAVLAGAPTTSQLVNKLKRDPDNLKLMSRLAIRYEKNLQFEKAVPLWEKIVNLPGTADKLAQEKALFSLGTYLGSIGRYSEAIRFLNQFKNQFPQAKDLVKARYCLALSYLGKGDKRKSLAELDSLSQYPLSESFKSSVFQLKKVIKESRRKL